MTDFIAPSPGQYYPRIFRPALWKPRVAEDEAMGPTGAVLRMLANDLDRLFEVVEPMRNNLDVFGYRIRHQLIVACTEVETALTGVLRANSYDPPGGRFLSTRDYVKLAAPMLLRDYLVRFPHYQSIEPFCPFGGWDEKKPTESLAWYSDYNLTKHDREANLYRATLRGVIQAVAAFYVLAIAQFGRLIFEEVALQGQTMISVAFEPECHLRESDYRRVDGSQWERVPYPF